MKWIKLARVVFERKKNTMQLKLGFKMYRLINFRLLERVR